jgi:hypothetical protein
MEVGGHEHFRALVLPAEEVAENAAQEAGAVFSLSLAGDVVIVRTFRLSSLTELVYH